MENRRVQVRVSIPGIRERMDKFVLVSVDFQKLAEQLAQKAYSNKSGKSKIAKGAVVITRD